MCQSKTYKLETKFDKAELTEALESKLAREPGTQELSAYGFTAPVKQSSELVIEAGDYMLICAEESKRDLPASVVKAEVDKQVEKIEHSFPLCRALGAVLIGLDGLND